MINPPMIVLADGISLIPKIGNQTQKIPPIISVKDNKVSSAAGKFLDPIEYSIKPDTTNNPCKADKDEFLNVVKKLASVKIKTKKEKTAQNNPAIATVVNFGVSFLHLKETEKMENPNAEARPNDKPNKEPLLVFPKAIIVIPITAIIIATQTFNETFSFKNKKPSKAVINGIAAKQSNVIAALVFVIDQIKVIIAIPSPKPPIIPENPILK